MLNFLFKNEERRRLILNIFVIAVIGMLILMVFDFIFYSTKSYSRLTNWVNPEKYQSIFLSNGQVYFGKVVDVNSETLVLTDVYYLKTYQNLQAGTDESAADTSLESFSLVKLGNEIHGPEDRMSINLDHVLFVEDLKDNSKVVEAIGEYKNQ